MCQLGEASVDRKYGSLPRRFWPEKLPLSITASLGLSENVNQYAGRGPGTSGPLYIVGLGTSPGGVGAAEVSLELDGGDG